MSSVFRRCSSWLLRPFWRPIEKMIERRVGPLEMEARQRLARLDAQADTIEQLLYARAGTLEGRVDQLEAALREQQAVLQRLQKGWRHHCPALMSGFSTLVQLEQEIRALRQEISRTHKEDQNHTTGI